MKCQPIVYLIDDEPVIRRSLTWAFQAASLELKAYESLEAFLQDTDPKARGCLILDFHFPRMTGIEILQDLRRRQFSLPIVFLSGAVDVASAVACMRLGAIDFLEKPVDPAVVIKSVRAAIGADIAKRIEEEAYHAAMNRLQSLTDRERELVQLICQGLSTKEIAQKLGVSHKTVTNHRTNVTVKTSARNTADIVRIAMTAERLKAQLREPQDLLR